MGNAHQRPEHLLPDYDLVFAVGKSAMEATACGCAVIPVSHDLGGDLITPENLASWTATNFGPRLQSPAHEISSSWLHTQLQAYDSSKTAEVTRQVRAAHDLQRAVDQLEAAYQAALSEHGARVPATTANETSALASYLEQVSADHEGALDKYQASVREAIETAHQESQRLTQAHQSLAAEQEKKTELRSRVDQLQRKLDSSEASRRQHESRWKSALAVLRRGPIGRLFLSRIQKTIAEEGTPGDSSTEDDSTRTSQLKTSQRTP